MRWLGFWLGLFLIFISMPAFAMDSLAQADNLRKQKQYDAARIVYLQFALESSDPDAAVEARFRAAQCLFDKKDFTAFEQEAAGLLRDCSDASETLRCDLELTSISLTMQRKNWKSATTKMAAFAAAHAGTIYAARAMGNQGEALEKRKKYDLARAVYIKIPLEFDNTTLTLEARHRAAKCLYENKKYLEFEKEATALMGENPPAKDRYVQQTKFLLTQFPDTQGRPLEAAHKLEAFAAERKNYHFEHHIALLYLKSANQSAKAGHAAEETALRSKADDYFRKERAYIWDRIKKKKLKPDDYHTRFTILETYYLQKDFYSLIQESQKLADEFHPPSRLWGSGMLWIGIAKASKPFPDYAGAAAALDAVIAAGIVDKDRAKHIPTNAAYWRLAVARWQKDDAAFTAAMDKLKKMPNGPVKKTALAKYAKNEAPQPMVINSEFNPDAFLDE